MIENMDIKRNQPPLPGLRAPLRPQRRVYGIFGLSEMTVAIQAGKAWVRIHFSEGAQTGYGVTPATYATTNPNIQAIIEYSPQFCSGRIKRIK